MPVMEYRTRDGLVDYGFSIESKSDGGWRVYIMFRPFHQGNNTLNLPYEATDKKGRRYVNWPGRIDSLGEAKTVAGLWVELVEPFRRAQEERALYADLIERILRAQKQGMVTPADQDLSDAAGGGGPDHEQTDCTPDIPSQRSRPAREEVA